MTTTHIHTVPGSWQYRIESFMAHSWIQHGLVFLILLNAAILGLETSTDLMQDWGEVLHWLDHGILGIFMTEIVVFGRTNAPLHPPARQRYSRRSASKAGCFVLEMCGCSMPIQGPSRCVKHHVD